MSMSISPSNYREKSEQKLCVSMQQTQKFLEVIPIEVRINKEVRDYQESLVVSRVMRKIVCRLWQNRISQQ